MTYLHDARGCCWLCSNQVSWWRQARITAGLSEEPLNFVYWWDLRIERRREQERIDRMYVHDKFKYVPAGGRVL